MKEIVSVSLGSSKSDYEFTRSFLGHEFRVRRFGTDYSYERAAQLLAAWDGKVDALGIGLVKDHSTVGVHRIMNKDTARLEAAVTKVPTTTGALLRGILHEWAVRHVQVDLGSYFNNARALFFSGITTYRLATVMAEYTPNLQFADPLLELRVPKLLNSVHALELYAGGASRVREWVPDETLSKSPVLLEQWNRHVLRKALARATTIVGSFDDIASFTPEELGGKTLISSAVSDHRLDALAELGVDVVIDGTPRIFERAVGLNIIDAMIIAALGKKPEEILYDDYFEIIDALGMRPRVLYPTGKQRRVNRFAFVIHPLSQEYFKTVKPIEVLSQVTPPVFMNAVEKILAHAPPFIYSHVTGIKSPTGVEAEGWLISVGGTPKELLSHSPEFTYRRLLQAAKMAKRLGAQIMGLGAFTKVVGDAGVTVAKRAELPITTGNSYSASGALWAAHDAVERMGLIELTHDRKVRGKAMIIGATGAIGSVCARLLAQAAEEIYLVSPETSKLLTLREIIQRDTPDAKVHLSTRADENLRDMDMIVTATSGAGKKILDIMKVKPGCVITDVARPLDLPPSEVKKRPDVLVIESGEILLPGDVQMRNIGLPKGIAYACLAETIVLCLEGRFENFTIGRNIEWEKVKQIYRLGLRHGMRLAAISGVNGVYSDADIARVRELALEALAKQAAESSETRLRGAEAAPAPAE